jgi:hypothetical protein
MSEEGRKFFRYVLPGLVYVIETLLFLLIVLPGPTKCFLSEISGKDILGPVATVFLLSGGLGFIFAAVHHGVFWYLSFEKYVTFENGILDHQEVIKKLHNLKVITLDNDSLKRIGLEPNQNNQNEVKKSTLKCSKKRKARMKAWTFSQSLWYHFLISKEPSKDSIVHPGKDAIAQLGHQAQGLGAARIASVFSLLTTIIIYSIQHGFSDIKFEDKVSGGLMLLLGIFIIWMFHSGYKRVADLAHGAYTITLVNECSEAENRSYLDRYCGNFKEPPNE